MIFYSTTYTVSAAMDWELGIIVHNPSYSRRHLLVQAVVGHFFSSRTRQFRLDRFENQTAGGSIRPRFQKDLSHPVLTFSLQDIKITAWLTVYEIKLVKVEMLFLLTLYGRICCPLHRRYNNLQPRFFATFRSCRCSLFTSTGYLYGSLRPIDRSKSSIIGIGILLQTHRLHMSSVNG